MGLADDLRGTIETEEALRLEMAVLDELESYLYHHGCRIPGKPAAYGIDLREVMPECITLAMMKHGFTPAEIEEMLPGWVESFTRTDDGA